MSFCPTKDIHSIYLDNEMPEIYKAEYESHLNSCEKCKKELEKLKKVHSILNSDASNLKLDQTFMDQSFERLQMKMKYSQTTQASKKQNSFNFKQFIPSVAAAAAVCTAILLPFQLKSNKNIEIMSQTAQYISPVQNVDDITFDSGRSIVVSGNIHNSVLSSNTNGNGNTAPYTGFVQNASTGVNKRDLVKDFDVFRPAFDENAKTIKITVPEMSNMPMQIEISFPDTVK